MVKIVGRIFNNKFIQGGMLLTITNFLVGFMNYLFNSLAGKALGPAKYSEITALFSYLFIFLVPIATISTEIIRRLGQKGKTRLTVIKSWESWFWKKIRRWSFLVLPYFLLILWLPRWTNLSLQSSISLLLILLLSFFSVFYAASLLGIHRLFDYSLALIIATFIKLIGPVLVILKLGNLSLILIFIVVSNLVLWIMDKILLQKAVKNQKAQPPVEKRIAEIIFTKSIFIIFITSISINLLNNLDVIFVKKFFVAETAGLYGAWNLYAKIIFYVLSPILTTGFIFFTAKEEQKKHLKTIFSSIILLIAAGFACYLFYRLFPRFVILFIFNQSYLSIKPILPYAAIFGINYCLISLLSGFFLSQNSYKAMVIFPFIIIYGVSLLLFGRGLEQIVTVNIIISTLIFLTYLGLILVKR